MAFILNQVCYLFSFLKIFHRRKKTTLLPDKNRKWWNNAYNKVHSEFLVHTENYLIWKNVIILTINNIHCLKSRFTCTNNKSLNVYVIWGINYYIDAHNKKLGSNLTILLLFLSCKSLNCCRLLKEYEKIRWITFNVFC